MKYNFNIIWSFDFLDTHTSFSLITFIFVNIVSVDKNRLLITRVNFGARYSKTVSNIVIIYIFNISTFHFLFFLDSGLKFFSSTKKNCLLDI